MKVVDIFTRYKDKIFPDVIFNYFVKNSNDPISIVDFYEVYYSNTGIGCSCYQYK